MHVYSVMLGGLVGMGVGYGMGGIYWMFGGAMGTMLVFLATTIVREPRDTRRELFGDIRTATSLVLWGLHGLAMFSNSFMESQERVDNFLILTSVVVMFFIALRNPPNTKPTRNDLILKIISLALCIKLSLYTTRGRHEGGTHNPILETFIPSVVLSMIMRRLLHPGPFASAQTRWTTETAVAWANVAIPTSMLAALLYWSFQNMAEYSQVVKLVCPMYVYAVSIMSLAWAIYVSTRVVSHRPFSVAGISSAVRAPVILFLGSLLAVTALVSLLRAL